MNTTLFYIGIVETILISIILFFKRPINIADKLLSSWFMVILLAFISNIVKLNLQIIEFWAFSLIIYLSFPPFIFLYTKYITTEHKKFNQKDLLHYSPAIICLILIIVLKHPDSSNIKTLADYYSNQLLLRYILGNTYVLSLWVYGILSLQKIKNYRKQMINAYSYNSGKINLNWLFILVLAYLLFYNIEIIINIFQFSNNTFVNYEHVSGGTLLIFVFVLGIFGFRQNQLTSVIDSPQIPTPQIKAPAKTEEEVSDKYKHSSLKEAQATAYMQKIIDYINASAIWKDNELSIDKISAQTDIPKYYISQVLNEKLQKNFYTFINEYRIEYAMKLIKSPEHKNWSFVAIAFESGFNSKSVFNSFFKKHTGMTPTEYKNKEVG